mmetsp:Transcript_28172/g.57168  ORF Transcript_28172/g.57168 Transcript_28172/m.57168 type:complete len:420 (-) Transcript_28172:1201-2460(-)
MSRSQQQPSAAATTTTNALDTLSDYQYFSCYFGNFEDGADHYHRGEYQFLDNISCDGLTWKLFVYPCGSDLSSRHEQFLSVGVCCTALGNNRIKHVLAQLSFRVLGDPPIASGPYVTAGLFQSSTTIVGADNFIPLSVLFGWNGGVPYTQRNGNLAIQVGIRSSIEFNDEFDSLASWTPPNTLSSDMMSMLGEAGAETADVFFQVGENKKRFHAHTTILGARAPFLASLAEEEGDGIVIPISGVEPDVFEILLQFVYGGKIPAPYLLKKHARALTDSADRFCCTGLKLAAEVELATSGLSNRTVADLVLFADAKNCAQLKESAIDFIIKNYDAVKATEGYSRVKESSDILVEIMSAMSSSLSSKKRKEPPSNDIGSGYNYKEMNVAMLRRELDNKGLELDGSKEMLISRLENANVCLLV